MYERTASTEHIVAAAEGNRQKLMTSCDRRCHAKNYRRSKACDRPKICARDGETDDAIREQEKY